jgi:hypothetical protein
MPRNKDSSVKKKKKSSVKSKKSSVKSKKDSLVKIKRKVNNESSSDSDIDIISASDPE